MFATRCFAFAFAIALPTQPEPREPEVGLPDIPCPTLELSVIAVLFDLHAPGEGMQIEYPQNRIAWLFELLDEHGHSDAQCPIRLHWRL